MEQPFPLRRLFRRRFIPAFAAFLGEGVPEREAIRRANLYAALSTAAIGTQKSFVNRRAFEKQWKKRQGEAP